MQTHIQGNGGARRGRSTSARLCAHIRSNVVGYIAIFFALSGGSAYALGGSNTVFSDDIVDGEVKEADVGQGAVASPEIKQDSILPGDVAPNSLTSPRIADDSLTGTDVANNSLKGADIDESTLDVGDAARAYALVDPGSCTGTPVTCTPQQSKGVSSVTRSGTALYCVTAPGIDSTQTPAAVTVDWSSTIGPAGNASAMTREGTPSCGPSGEGFVVFTERQHEISPFGPIESAVEADDVGFTIVIP